MARRKAPEYVEEININNSRMTSSGEIAKLDSDLNDFQRAIMSALNDIQYKMLEPKRVGSSGYTETKFIIENGKGALAQEAMNYVNTSTVHNRHGGDNGWNYDINLQKYKTVKGYRTLHGQDAYDEALSQIRRYGGDMWRNPTKDNPDRVQYFYPDDISSARGKDKRDRDIWKEAKNMSLTELQNRKIIEDKKETALANVQASKNMDEENKRNMESADRMYSIVTKVLAGITAIIDITRRILTSAVKQATAMDKDSSEAHSIGLTYMQKRAYDIFDKGHNLNPGTTVSAIEGLQAKFGDITHTDSGAIDTLALVMGSGVSDLINSGIGGDKPGDLLKDIMDAYFQQYLNGMNNVGDVVGRDKARINLKTSLASVDQNLADIFDRMAEDYERGNYGQFTNYTAWLATTSTNKTGVLDAEAQHASDLGTVLAGIQATLEDLKTGYLLKLINKLEPLIQAISNLRVGKSATENINENATNRELNRENMIKASGAMKVYANNLNSVIGKEKTSKYQYALNKSVNAEMLGDYATMNEQQFKNTYGVSGNEYKKIGSIYESILLDQNLNDDLAYYVAEKQLNAEMTEQNRQENPAKVTYNKDAVTTKAKTVLKNRDLSWIPTALKSNGEWASEDYRQIMQRVFAQYLNEDDAEGQGAYTGLINAMFGGAFTLDKRGNVKWVKDTRSKTEVGGEYDTATRDRYGGTAWARQYNNSTYRNKFLEMYSQAVQKKGGQLTQDEIDAIYKEIILSDPEALKEFFNLFKRGNANDFVNSNEVQKVLNEDYYSGLENGSDSAFWSAILNDTEKLQAGSYNYGGVISNGHFILTIKGVDGENNTVFTKQVDMGAREGNGAQYSGTFTVDDKGTISNMVTTMTQ